MPNEFSLAFAQSLRWIIAGIAGAGFAKHDVLDKNFRYLIGYLVPTILMLAFVEYLILLLVETP